MQRAPGTLVPLAAGHGRAPGTPLAPALAWNDGDVRVWTAAVDGTCPCPLRLLTRAERARRAGFARAQDAEAFVVARTMARVVLAAHAGIEPATVRFRLLAGGKPLATNAALARISFSLAHTKDLAVLAVASRPTGASRRRAASRKGALVGVGVDVERIDRTNDVAKMAERLFAQSEVDELARVARRAPHELRRRFYWHWALKEAYAKARGMGLSLPIDQVAFSFARDPGTGGPAIRATFGPRIDDAPSAWRFGLFERAPLHVVAFAVGSP
jgi:4'-phosphopantetheinyl transferase